MRVARPIVTGSPSQSLSVIVTGSERNYLIPSSPSFQKARVSFPSNAHQNGHCSEARILTVNVDRGPTSALRGYGIS